MAYMPADELYRSKYAYAGNFSSLLPLGIITLNSFTGLPGPAPTAPDGWNWAPPLPWIDSKRGSLESELEFLCFNDFIRATYCIIGKAVGKIRIYVCPEDCEWYLSREVNIEYRGRAILKKLWALVDVSPQSWNSQLGTTCQYQPCQLLSDDDIPLNLSAIFNSLPSPQPDPELTAKAPAMLQTMLESVLDDDGVPGFRSQLYQYQRESVWKMLQRELLPQRLNDPRLRKWIGPTGVQSWINVDDMTFFRKQRYVEDIQGGILCEEMGTGKTCICLALILLTIHQRAQPPRGERVEQKKASSLFQQCMNTIVAHGIPFRHLDPRPHFYSELENAMPYYLLKPPPPKRARRNPVPIVLEPVYLTTCTLVVVPDTLIQQWSTEILKHVNDNVLNYQLISKATQSIPSVEEIMKLDILLLSHSRFAKEDDDGRFDEYGFIQCRCWYQHTCTCSSLAKTALLQVRWKRVIIDEGHILAQGNTRLVSLAGRLRVERRWCVTGTVSNHMMGMDLGMERTLSGNPIDQGVLTPPDEGDVIAARKPEQLDLKRFGAILIDFLHVPPFTSTDIWNRYVVRPYTENLTGNMSSLRSVMSLMIRHRPRDIEKDIVLPPLHSKTILLDPTPENRLSINVITALIASNAVLTQRCDQDYFFHPSQIKFRDEVVRNLVLAAFHFTGTSVQSVIEAIQRAETGLQKAQERRYSDDDVKLLEKVITCLKEAMSDDRWRTLAVKKQNGREETSPQEMGYFLEYCSSEINEAWAMPKVDNLLQPNATSKYSLFSGPTLLTMQSQSPSLSVTSKEDHISYLASAGQTHRRQVEQSALQSQETNHSPKKPDSQRNDEEQKLRKVIQHERDHYDLSKPESPRKRPRLVQTLMTPPASPPSGVKSILKVTNTPDEIAEDSPLKKIMIQRTASAKLNYLLKRIMELQKDEKIIVFSDYAPIMWYLGECLEILGIEHLIYIQRLAHQRRSQYIVTFNSSPHYRILIMETKVAAHGLNVTAASRVFFLNACWQKSVERQAIKRAHRIGQQREVYVETLVLKDTIEEELLIRREEMGREQLDRTKRFTDDGKLRGIISSAKFVPPCSEEMADCGFGPLFRVKEKTDEIEKELDVAEEGRPLKKRKVEFGGPLNEYIVVREGPKSPKKHKRSKMVILKLPSDILDDGKKSGTPKKRKVQFAD